MGWNEDYNDVPARIREFRTRHPEGSLQAEIIPSPFEGFVAVRALAYRTPDDERPGIGLAWEPVPGKTNFTRDSELQNAETSAWGRAIVAVGAADTKKGIASAEDVRNRSSEEAPARGPSSGASGDVRATSSRLAGPSPDSSVPPTSVAEGVGTGSSGGGEGGSVDGEAAGQPEPPSDSLDRLFELYLNKAHALRAANKRFGVKSLDELGPAAVMTLIRDKEESNGAS